jgi:hypothetical protein
MSTTPIFRSVRLLPKSAVELDRLYGDKGEIFYDSTTRTLRIFDGADQGGTQLNASVSVSGTPPEYPTQGSLWFNSTTGAIYLYYQDSSSNQWIAPVVSASGSGGGGGASLTAFSVTTASPGLAGLSYNNTSGVFTFTPPDLSSYATTASLSSYVTSTALTSTLGGYATTSSLGSYVTSTTLTSTLGGYATTSALSLAVSGVAYTLPTASNLVLGGVKVDGSTININNGVISTPVNTRSVLSVVSTSLANGASGNFTIVGFKGYFLYSIQTSHAAWVVLYNGNAARTADSSRTETTDPLPNAGVVAEAITTGAETIVVSPAVVGFNIDALTDIPIKITNKSGSTQSITVTLTLLKMES